MNILILNPGSTSLKFKLYRDLNFIIGGGFRNIDDAKFEFHDEEKNETIEIAEDEYYTAIKHIRDWCADHGGIDMVGVRVVHGGEKFIKPTLLTEEVIKELREVSDLAPLHNPPALSIIEDVSEYLPNINKYAVFDTEFHSKMPEKAYLYGLPYNFYTEYGVRRYGFHGISHEYLSHETANLLLDTEHPNPAFDRSQTYSDVKMITIHLGGGASITAIKNGKSVDTSMGFTPLEGLLMSTRAGDVDDGVYTYLKRHIGFTLEELDKIINKQSGLLGVSGESGSMKELLVLEKEGNEGAHRAIELYIYKVQKYIGSYIAALNGVESVTFSGAIGTGSADLRKRICSGLSGLGLEIDDSQNDDNEVITKEIGKGMVRIFSIPTNEELMIATKLTRLTP